MTSKERLAIWLGIAAIIATNAAGVYLIWLAFS
jgi:hypothetical protein